MKLPLYALATLVMSLSIVVAVAPASQAKVSVTVSAGMNACIDDEPGDCSRIESSGVGGLGIFYEVLPKLSMGLDLRFGALTPQEDAANVEQGISTFHVLPTAVWIERINERLMVEGRVGFGYGSYSHSFKSVVGADQAITWVSWSTLALGAALSMEVIEQLDAGIGMDLYLQGGGSICTKTTGTACKDQEDPVFELFSTVLFARYRL